MTRFKCDPSSPAARVALITGANTGIGRVTALELARHGFHVFLACRSLERTQPVLDEIRSGNPAAVAEWIPLELSDFESVRTCAKAFLELQLPLHLLVNNAGLAGARGRTKSGFEFMFGVNHMGHFLLTQLLLERLKDCAPARIVTVASRAHLRVRDIDWDAVLQPTATVLSVKEYGVSKLANVLFSAKLGRHLQGAGVVTSSLHPGVVDSDIWRNLPRPFRALNRLRLVSVEQGAKTTLHCALAEGAALETGLYYSDSRAKLPSAAAMNLALADELWQRSLDWIK